MHETGLLEEWTNKFNPVSIECSAALTKKKKNGKPQISLKNLTSAFILLIFGICLSILVFVAELIYHRFKLHSA
jgi:ionotropic glutamate receptor